ncbi:MAG: NFACT RNA binding domain-containing protein [Bacillota bacterium]|nr:NFACT RNA binding domain-containing protein [Bacillota bacterium]
MPFDGLVLAAVRAELAGALTGGRIERVQQPAEHYIVLTVHRHKRHRLLISNHPEEARVHMTAHGTVSPPRLPVFAAVLRKYLEGGRMVSIKQPGFERVIEVVVRGRDALGQEANILLIGEFMGKHSNILLVDPGSGRILDGIRRYTHAVSRHREVLPGAPYIPPPRTKRDPLELDEEGLTAELLALPLESGIARALQARLEGLSLVAAREVAHRAGLAAETTVGECGAYDFARLWSTLRDVFAGARDGALSPCLALDRAGEPYDFSAISLTHLSDEVSLESGGMNDILDRFYTHHRERQRLEGLRRAIMSIVARERRRVEKRLAHCRKNLATAARFEEWRRYGDLLIANLHAVPPNAETITLNEFETGKPVAIALDPKLSPAANAQAYFRRFQKQKATAARAAAEEERLSAELEYLAGVETALMQAENSADLGDIREELVAQGYLSAPAPGKKRAPAREAAPAPLTFKAPDGTTILVGKNNRQNDYVTFRVAREDDLWLHARGIPGAHVIVRTAGRAVSPEALEAAASLAAYYSRSRQAGSVPVDVTLRRHVKKPRGARPGFVIYREERTVMARPARPS